MRAGGGAIEPGEELLHPSELGLARRVVGDVQLAAHHPISHLAHSAPALVDFLHHIDAFSRPAPDVPVGGRGSSVRRVKPLVRAVYEYRVTALGQLAVGIALGLAGLALSDPAAGAVGWAVAALLFWSLFYWLVMRRNADRFLDEPPAPPTDERESASATRKRLAKRDLPLAIVLIALAFTWDAPELAGGIVAGGGLAFVMLYRRVSAWEEHHRSVLLREPRWRFSRPGPRGWGRGRGLDGPARLLRRAGARLWGIPRRHPQSRSPP